MKIDKGLTIDVASWSCMCDVGILVVGFSARGVYERPGGSWDYRCRVKSEHQAQWVVESSEVKAIKPDSPKVRKLSIAKRIIQRMPPPATCMDRTAISFTSKDDKSKIFQFQDDLILMPVQESENLRGFGHFKFKRRRDAILVEVAPSGSGGHQLLSVEIGVTHFLEDYPDLCLDVFLCGVKAVQHTFVNVV